MTDLERILNEAEKLSLADRMHLIEQLSARLRQELEVEAYKQMPWKEFLARTYGSTADSPIERAPQPPLEEREPLE